MGNLLLTQASSFHKNKNWNNVHKLQWKHTLLCWFCLFISLAFNSHLILPSEALQSPQQLWVCPIYDVVRLSANIWFHCVLSGVKPILYTSKFKKNKKRLHMRGVWHWSPQPSCLCKGVCLIYIGSCAEVILVILQKDFAWGHRQNFQMCQNVIKCA